MLTLRIARGRCLPLGASAQPDGVNFALLCRHGTAVFLVVYALEGAEPIAEIALHPRRNRTGDHWHVLVAGLPPAFGYGWRVDGPRSPGHCYDPNTVLLDPAATALSNGAKWGMSREPEKHRSARRSVYIRRPFHWQEDAPLVTPLEDAVVYELHVRGFTCHPSSLTAHPGTFAGLVEKMPYLQSLGVTAVELLPIHEFDETDCPFINPVNGEQQPEPLGLQQHRLRRRQGVLRQHGRRPRPARRVPRDGARLPRGRPRNLPRRGVQPHRRGRLPRPHLLLPRPGQPPLLHDRPRRPLFELFRVRKHRQFQPPRRPPAADELPALLGGRHARGRPALRPGLGHGPRLPGRRAGRAAGRGDDRRGGGAERHQADRRAVGRRRPLSGRPLPVRPALVGVERPLPRRRAPLLARRLRHGRRPGDAPVRAAPTCTAPPAACRATP